MVSVNQVQQFLSENRRSIMQPVLEIRPERPVDIEAVRELNQEAFNQGPEAGIVDRLRENCPDIVSLVAVDGGEIIGHVLFSPVTIDGSETATGMGLAPMSVLPDRQRQGVGSFLIEAGLDILRSRKCPFVIVLGHAEYYPRFGFEPASKCGLTSQWDGIPDEAFMAILLDEDTMAGVQGIARYRSEFDEAM